MCRGLWVLEHSWGKNCIYQSLIKTNTDEKVLRGRKHRERKEHLKSCVSTIPLSSKRKMGGLDMVEELPSNI